MYSLEANAARLLGSCSPIRGPSDIREMIPDLERLSGAPDKHTVRLSAHVIGRPHTVAAASPIHARTHGKHRASPWRFICIPPSGEPLMYASPKRSALVSGLL